MNFFRNNRQAEVHRRKSRRTERYEIFIQFNFQWKTRFSIPFQYFFLEASAQIFDKTFFLLRFLWLEVFNFISNPFKSENSNIFCSPLKMMWKIIRGIQLSSDFLTPLFARMLYAWVNPYTNLKYSSTKIFLLLFGKIPTVKIFSLALFMFHIPHPLKSFMFEFGEKRAAFNKKNCKSEFSVLVNATKIFCKLNEWIRKISLKNFPSLALNFRGFFLSKFSLSLTFHISPHHKGMNEF